MQREEIYKILNKIFQDVFDDESIAVYEQMTAADIEEWDSLEQIHLIVSIEKKFHIKFDMEEVSRMKTVGNMADGIWERLNDV